MCLAQEEAPGCVNVVIYNTYNINGIDALGACLWDIPDEDQLNLLDLALEHAFKNLLYLSVELGGQLVFAQSIIVKYLVYDV